MLIRLSGEVFIAAAPARVWPLLLDPEFIDRCAAGLDSMERVTDTHFLATTEVELGPFTFSVPLHIHLRDLVRPHSATMEVHGEAPGVTLKTISTIELAPNGNGTQLQWTSRSEAHGVVAIVAGRPLRQLTERRAVGFWEAFAREAPIHITGSS